MKTETELKKTWCPFARNLVVVEVDGNPRAAAGVNVSRESGVGDVMALCLGLACSQCVDCGVVKEFGPACDFTKHKSPDDDPDKPKGEGWKIGRSTSGGALWVRETGERYAYCGRNVGEALRYEIADAIDNINR